jgi:hypothetical protein
MESASPASFLIENEPYYLSTANEIEVFEAAYRARLPVMPQWPG